MVGRIPIHLLHTQAFCEYQLFLERVKRVQVERTLDMQIGDKIHAMLEEEHHKKAIVLLASKRVSPPHNLAPAIT